jgi:hypothetical protein
MLHHEFLPVFVENFVEIAAKRVVHIRTSIAAQNRGIIHRRGAKCKCFFRAASVAEILEDPQQILVARKADAGA